MVFLRMLCKHYFFLRPWLFARAIFLQKIILLDDVIKRIMIHNINIRKEKIFFDVYFRKEFFQRIFLRVFVGSILLKDVLCKFNKKYGHLEHADSMSRGRAIYII